MPLTGVINYVFAFISCKFGRSLCRTVFEILMHEARNSLFYPHYPWLTLLFGSDPLEFLDETLKLIPQKLEG